MSEQDDMLAKRTHDLKLVGWLCIARHQWTNGVVCTMPRMVSIELIRRGWMRECDGSDECEEWNAHLTDAGTAKSDLCAPEWFINPIGATP